eukprot:Gb_06287 [translate_table: standard]
MRVYGRFVGDLVGPRDKGVSKQVIRCVEQVIDVKTGHGKVKSPLISSDKSRQVPPSSSIRSDLSSLRQSPPFPSYRCALSRVYTAMAASAHITTSPSSLQPGHCRKPHVLLLPSLGFGHLIPFTELALQLAQRGLLVSLVVTHHHLSVAQSKIQADGQRLDLRLVELDVSQVEELHQQIGGNNSNSVANHEMAPILVLNDKLEHPFENLLHRLLYDASQTPPPPLCIVTDFLLGWTHTLAAKFGIPRINVECSPPYSKNLLEITWLSLPRNLPRTSSGRYVVPHQAKYTLLSRSQMPPHLPDADESHPEHLLSQRNYPLNRQSWLTVSNTFYELESIHVDQFQTRYAGPVRPIGPLLPRSVFHGGYRSRSNAQNAAAEMEWLDAQLPASVVYVSFGSENSVSASQIAELAMGLEASGKPFLWVLRLPCDVTNRSDKNALDFLPEGFCIRTRARGRVVMGWTNQLAVLSHPSVGVFISHCGWNSAVEAIANGIPLICWPLFAEQHFNAKFIVEEAKFGIDVVRDGDGLVRREVIARVVTTMLSDDDELGKELKTNAKHLADLAKEAISEGGSSLKNFDKMVEDIVSLQNLKMKSSQMSPNTRVEGKSLHDFGVMLSNKNII